MVCLGSLVFGAVLWEAVVRVNAVMHPESPVFTSDSLRIQLFFSALVVLLLLVGWQMARGLVRQIKVHRPR